jgi:hypothetical protein
MGKNEHKRDNWTPGAKRSANIHRPKGGFLTNTMLDFYNLSD